MTAVPEGGVGAERKGDGRESLPMQAGVTLH